ncbi:MAG TPA: TatD family hydrolase, partial [Vicinamibacterales bacterium]|nr:TatD family hydrolase [Vicinamibacterales bacterium]
VHTREADDDTIALLRGEGGGRARGVFHCFSGDERLARRALALGFSLSFSGIVTFPKAESVRGAAAIVPLDRLLVETDAPYLAPVPPRGRRNEPCEVVEVVKTLAGVHRVAPETLAAATASNYRNLFNP